MVVEAVDDAQGGRCEGTKHGNRLVHGMPLPRGSVPKKSHAKGHGDGNAQNHGDAVQRRLPVGCGLGEAELLSADGLGVLGQDGSIRALGPLQVDGEGAVSLVVLERGILSIAVEALLGAIGVNGLYAGRRDVHISTGRAASWPAATVLGAFYGGCHVPIVEASAVEQFVFHLVKVLGFVVTVGEAWGEGDAGGALVSIYDQVQGAGHVVATQADSGPRDVLASADAEVDIGTVVVADGNGECDVAVGGDEGRLATFAVIFVFGQDGG